MDMDNNTLKKIAHDIIDDELSKIDTEYKVLPITIVEYYNELIFKKKYSLIKKVKESAIPIVTGGFNEKNERIVIFLDHFSKDDKLFKFVMACYHEARHSIQHTFEKYSYEGFFRDVDFFLRSQLDYLIEHDNYFFEMDANKYAVNKAREYMLDSYPNLYYSQLKNILDYEEKYDLDCKLYDTSDTIERMLQTLKRINKAREQELVFPKQAKEISPVLDIFMTDSNTFKSFKEIISHKDFKKLDKRISYAIICSKSFLEQLNIEILTLEELEILNKALQYTNNIYQEQNKLLDYALENKRISNLEYFKKQKSIIKKIAFIERDYRSKLLKLLNFKRSYKKKKKHMESVPLYLDKTNKLVKKLNNNGFLTIDIIYIIAFIISAINIIYILSN